MTDMPVYRYVPHHLTEAKRDRIDVWLIVLFMDQSETLAKTFGSEACNAALAEIAGAVVLPVNADYQAGYADDVEELAESVRLCIAAGVSRFRFAPFIPTCFAGFRPLRGRPPLRDVAENGPPAE